MLLRAGSTVLEILSTSAVARADYGIHPCLQVADAALVLCGCNLGDAAECRDADKRINERNGSEGVSPADATADSVESPFYTSIP